MRILALSIGIALVAVGAALAKPAVIAQTQQSRIIDRTVVCATPQGNPREINVAAASGTRLFGDASKWKSLSRADFFHPAQSISVLHGGVSAGSPYATADGGAEPRANMLTYSSGCRRSSMIVPLTTRGLVGGPASQVGDDYDCVVPRRIVVRLRAVFYAPTSLRRVRSGFHVEQLARGRTREGTLAIRTESGKPIALATVHEPGRARLFVGNTCGPSG